LSETLAVITVDGELDLATSETVAAAVDAALEAGATRVAFDLCRCPFIDSTAIKLLLRVQRRLEDAGEPRIAVACVTPELRRTLGLTGVDRVIPTLGSREEAVAALGSEEPETGPPG
jgi:anti-anti-sigma factor